MSPTSTHLTIAGLKSLPGMAHIAALIDTFYGYGNPSQYITLNELADWKRIAAYEQLQKVESNRENLITQQLDNLFSKVKEANMQEDEWHIHKGA
jgi:hypothetical protein